MNFSQLGSKLRSFYRSYIKPPKEWSRPKKSEILIYDSCGAGVLQPYLTSYSVTVMAVRGESVNLLCLLQAALTIDFWKGSVLNVYTDAYIRAVSPKLVITYIDNNTNFYLIGSRFNNIATVFIQNGSRSQVGDVFNKLTPSMNYRVDYMFVHGTAIGEHYQSFISGSVISLGSFRNNEVDRSLNEKSDSIVFVSQYFERSKDDSSFVIDANGKSISWQQFFAAELVVLKFLNDWCRKYAKPLLICGRSSKEVGPERDFFQENLTDCVWEFIPKRDSYSSYNLVDSARIVVFIDSTLGYESLGRGNRTASFSCRGADLSSEGCNFGWPAKLSQNGPFWTNKQDDTEFERVMDYLIGVSDEEWGRVCQSHTHDLINFDPNNKQFVKVIDELLMRPCNAVM